MRAVVPLLLTVVGCLSVASAQASQVRHQPQSAVDQSEVDSAWQSLTKVDVEAAYRLLRDNHPAASPDANDPAFIAALDRAQKQGLARARTVRSLDGYAATLREFANTMGDGHISSYTRFDRETVTWAGMIAAKRGVDWIVARADKDVVGADIIGGQITACDGEPIARLAQRVMHFRTVAGSEATQIMRAGRLLLDDGNPFLSRPKVCEFKHGGVIKSVTLNWQEVGRDQLQKTYWKPVPGAAGFGLRSVGQGYWLSIEALEPKAQLVIDQATRNAKFLRNSAYVVVDLRGNSGGNDRYGRKLAEALYGTEYVDARLGPVASSCPPVFRASSENIDAVRKQITAFRASGDTDAASDYARGLQAMEASKSSGRALTGAATCQTATQGKSVSSSLMRAPVIVLTDVGCFSSCINTVGWFRKLGAMQVGQITGADTHYSEVREVVLPSGLSTFATMMALMPDAPAHIGPFVPATLYDGDVADTAALETWIPAHALSTGTHQ